MKEYAHGSYGAFLMLAHLVLVTKYRKTILVSGLAEPVDE
jgi:REP element-mobilizing transposase RayT